MSIRPSVQKPRDREPGGVPAVALGSSPTRIRARNPSGATVSNLVRILLAIFLPPVAVLMTNGIGLQFFLNILLTIFFVLPGTIHALWLVLRER
jgi:uncharacterized membrane protein YqaE (UPF0057 family)